MTTRTRIVLAWLSAGHAAVGGLYWLLLQVPESNAWMLLASALVAIAAVLLLGWVEMAAALGLNAVMPMREAARLGARRAWLIVLPLAVFGCFWLVTAGATGWLEQNAGRIDAWVIARTGWTRTTGLHSAAGWIVAFVRYGIGVSLAAALLRALAVRGLPGLGTDWVRSGLSGPRLIAVSAALMAGFWLPWHAAYWRPAWLPPTWVQPAFAAAKLLAIFIVANAGWAFILRRAPRERARSSPEILPAAAAGERL